MIKLKPNISYFRSLRFISSSRVLRKDDDDKASDATNKLNSLLSELAKERSKPIAPSKIEVSKPQQLKSKKELKIEMKEKKKEPTKLGDKIADAAKKVAEKYGGDTKKTESELLNLLLAYQKDPTGESPTTSKPVLQDLITGMKIERDPEKEFKKPVDQSVSSNRLEGRAREVNHAMGDKRPFGSRSQQRQTTSQEVPQEVNLWLEKDGLGIFDVKNEFTESISLSTWSKLYAKDLKLSITHPPSNIYEQMILWTEQGKLWQFPINNEQGMDDESKVDFTEHVMLDHYLEPWCPKKGPVRTFMEMVLIGLSKNPYYKVEDKVEHIHWFRDYFAYKNEILKSLEIPEIPDPNPNFNIDITLDYKAFK